MHKKGINFSLIFGIIMAVFALALMIIGCVGCAAG